MSANQHQKPPAYRLLAGDELGVLRVIEIPAGPRWADAALTQKWGEPDKQRAVCSLCCSANSGASSTGDQVLVAVGRKGGRVDIIDAASGAAVGHLQAAGRSSSRTDSKTEVAAVAFIPAAAGRPLQLVVASSDGMLSVCSSQDSGTWQVTRSHEVANNVTCMAVDDDGRHLVVGSDGQQPALWELASLTKIWQAKGGKPNKIGLVDLAHTTAVAFLPGSSTTTTKSSSSSSQRTVQQPAAAAAAAAQATGNGAGGETAPPTAAVARRFVCGSVSAKLHVYDTAVGRRPQLEVAFGETRVTSLAPEDNAVRVWAANGTGHIQLLDLQQKKLLDALKGAGGSVRGLALHPAGEPLLASVGLDRFLRVHSTTGRESVGRVYLKQQLNAVCWLPRPAAAAGPAAAAAGPTTAAAGVEAAAVEAEQQEKEHQPRKKSKKNKARQAADGNLEAAAGTAAPLAAAAAAAAVPTSNSSKKRRKQAAVAADV